LRLLVVAGANSDVGVPDRRAQPAPSGPLGSHSTVPTAKHTSAPSDMAPKPPCSGQPEQTRMKTASSTAARQPPLIAIIHGALMSVPVPRPCGRAVGHV